MNYNNRGRSLLKHTAKLIFLGILDALAIWSAIILFSDKAYYLLLALIAGTIAINFVYLIEKAYPLRYILPGTLFMIALVVYPIVYTVYISFTNYGTGHILSKDQVINQLNNRYYNPPDAQNFNFSAFKSPESDDFAVLLYDDEQKQLFLGLDNRAEKISRTDTRLHDTDGDGEIDKINQYERIPQREIYQNLSSLQDLEFYLPQENTMFKMKNVRTFSEYEVQFKYIAEEDKIINLKTDEVYQPRDGYFRNQEGKKLYPGFRTHVGLDNYIRLLTDERIFKPFLRVFTWTFEWAFLSVLTTFVLGLFMAILLNDKRIKFRKIYRVILILPYAIPAFISVLIWRGLFNTHIGVVNEILEFLSIQPVQWMQSPFWAKVALLIVNLWLGFPYMMLLSLGALQSIPENLYEAAAIDGASPWQRLRHITLPLLLVSLGPLLISSFAFNFNNFNVIYLFNEGGPAIPNTQTPAGGTDILISYTYRLSFSTGRGADFGLASTVALFIFTITAIITWFNFKYTGALEDVKENV